MNLLSALLQATRSQPHKTMDVMFKAEAAETKPYTPEMPFKERLEHARISKKQWKEDAGNFTA